MTEKKEVPIVNKTTGERVIGHQVVKTPRPNSMAFASDHREQSERSEHLEHDEHHEHPGHSEEVTADLGQSSPQDAIKNKKRKKPAPSSLLSLIELGYARNGQRISAKAIDLKAIADSASVPVSDSEKLHQMASGDKYFAVPRQLLLLARELGSAPRVRAGLRTAVGGLLERQDLVVVNQLQSVVRNQDDAPSLGAAIRKVMETDPGVLRSYSHAETELRAGELSELKRNVVGCLSVWVTETRAMSSADLMSEMMDGYWESFTRTSSEEEVLRLITEVGDPRLPGWLCREFGSRLTHQAMLAEQSDRAATVAKREFQRMSLEMSLVNGRISEVEAALNVARADLQGQMERARVEEAHLRNDIQLLRTRVLRRLRDDVKLLGDGLLALTRDPPKVEVMVDHAERVVESLGREIGKLEE